MIILKNINNDIEFTLRLYKTHEFPNWIGYEIKIYTIKDDVKTEFLTMLYPEYLYFENIGYSEIVEWVYHISLLLNGNVNETTFEPVDEKNFTFTLKQYDKDTFEFSFKSRQVFLTQTTPWNYRAKIGIHTIITREELLNFQVSLYLANKSLLEIPRIEMK